MNENVILIEKYQDKVDIFYNKSIKKFFANRIGKYAETNTYTIFSETHQGLIERLEKIKGEKIPPVDLIVIPIYDHIDEISEVTASMKFFEFIVDDGFNVINLEFKNVFKKSALSNSNVKSIIKLLN
jgi:hypothetical protein